MPAVVNSLPPSASELPAHNPSPPPFHNNLPQFDHSAFTRCRRALEYVWACLEIAWAKLQDIWNTTRRKFTLSTWLAISISVIVGGLGLRYAYVQVVLGYEALRLAEWTAKKDFWELCQEQRVCRPSVINHVPQDADRYARSRIIQSARSVS